MTRNSNNKKIKTPTLQEAARIRAAVFDDKKKKVVRLSETLLKTLSKEALNECTTLPKIIHNILVRELLRRGVTPDTTASDPGL